MNTRRWLHSHKFPSPLSGNQEVRLTGMRHLLMHRVMVDLGISPHSGDCPFQIRVHGHTNCQIGLWIAAP